MSSTLIDKVRKLRALAESSNVNEAAAAAAAAERLIQEHNLSEATLHLNEDDEHVEKANVVEMGATVATWHSVLLAHLQKAYQCCGFIDRPDGKSVFIAYGRRQDIETLQYQFAFFTSEITRLCERLTKGKGRTFANSFRLGAVSAIADALFEARRTTRQAASSTALVVVDRRAELAKERRDDDHPDLRQSNARSYQLNQNAFAMGKRAGANINQRSQIGAAGNRLLGGRS